VTGGLAVVAGRALDSGNYPQRPSARASGVVGPGRICEEKTMNPSEKSDARGDRKIALLGLGFALVWLAVITAVSYSMAL
jgi:hypothetical protein